MTVIQEPALREKAQRTPKSNRKSLSEAKTEFLSAVNHAVCELMDRSRYSRERATAVLLREIQQNDKSPTDSEVGSVSGPGRKKARPLVETRETRHQLLARRFNNSMWLTQPLSFSLSPDFPYHENAWNWN